MAKNVTVLSEGACSPISFKNIADIEHSDTLNEKDTVIVIASNGNGEMKNVEIRELASFFINTNYTTSWYLPVINNSTISWELVKFGDKEPEDIDIVSMIPVATSEKDGLMPATAFKSLINAIPVRTKITLTSIVWDTLLNQYIYSIAIDTEGKHITVEPTPASAKIFRDCGIICTEISEHGITFECDTIPTTDIELYVLSTVVRDV